jgi:hypothetical protein
VETGCLTETRAVALANKLFYENAERIFGLDRRKSLSEPMMRMMEMIKDDEKIFSRGE